MIYICWPYILFMYRIVSELYDKLFTSTYNSGCLSFIYKYVHMYHLVHTQFFELYISPFSA